MRFLHKTGFWKNYFVYKKKVCFLECIFYAMCSKNGTRIKQAIHLVPEVKIRITEGTKRIFCLKRVPFFYWIFYIYNLLQLKKCIF
jgi:hypothetical protein